MATQLPPPPGATKTPKPGGRHGMDNRPSWMTASDSAKRLSFKDDDATPNDNRRKKERLWVFFANILVSNTKNIAPPMPLDVDNGY